jgi:hypothetical protein
MGEKKIGKDWYETANTAEGRRRISKELEKSEVKSLEDLVDLVRASQAAPKIGVSTSQATELMKSGVLQGRKIRGRWYTSAHWILDYLTEQDETNG